MRIIYLSFFLVSFVSVLPLLGAPGPPEGPPAPVLSSRGAHWNVWTRNHVIALPNGRTHTRQSSFVEFGVGLNHWDAVTGQFVSSSNEIELVQDGAIARKTPHQVSFPDNGADPLDVLLPDGRRWTTQVEGLVLHDPQSGRSEVLTEVEPCAGQLLPQGVVLYSEAMDSPRAGIRYTHRINSIEQDIVLWERFDLPPTLPGQPAYGPATRLEIWTSLLHVPEHSRTLRQVGSTTDSRLDFGCMFIGSGRAFMLSDPHGQSWTVPMAKAIVQTDDGQWHMVESVELNGIQAQLNTLPAPKQGAAVRNAKPARQMAVNAAGQRSFPRRAGPAVPAKFVGKLQLAANGTGAGAEPGAASDPAAPASTAQTANAEPRNGLVLDYALVATATNITITGDSTWYIASSSTLSGSSNVIEGGAVLKYATGVTLTIAGALEFRSSAYSPAIFTSWRDDTVGEVIGSGSSPLTNRAGTFLYFDSYASGIPAQVSCARFSYGGTAMTFMVGTNHEVRHVQILHCNSALTPYYTTLFARNLLAYDVQNVFSGSIQSTSHVEHGTFNVAARLNESSNVTLCLTNCLLVAVTNTCPYIGEANATESDPATCFQTVGAGAHYLANGSPHRNAGTTNISAALLSDLRQRTTYPPVVLSGWVTLDLTLAPHVQRDTDLPDIGHHLAVLDHVWSSVAHSNATLTIEPGTAIGITTAPDGWGLAQYEGSTILASGEPDRLVRFARYNTVQEQANTNWVGLGWSVLPSGWVTASPNAIRCAFAAWTMLANSGNHIVGWYNNPASMTFRDCQLFGGGLLTYRPTLSLTNCLLHRVVLGGDDGGGEYLVGLTVRHCTFIGGTLNAFHFSSDTWTFTDNLFDRTDNYWMSFWDVTNSFNGYVTNAVCSRLLPNSPTDTVTNVAPLYELGALGSAYLPANCAFIDTGSTNAHLLGFFHSTTSTNQTKEATSRIDLGFHFVALNGTSSGSVPLDFDGDSFADHIEDLDGDGVPNGGESDWTTYNSRYGVGPGPGLVVFTPLK